MYWILDKVNNVHEYVETLKEAKYLFNEYYADRTEYRIEKAKNFYEVGLMKHVEGSVEDDFETVDFIGEGCTYRECVRIAKEESMKWDACSVVCYTWTDDTMYEEIFHERYEKGKKQFRKNIKVNL